MMMDRIRSEVAIADVRVHTRYRQIKVAEHAVATAKIAWDEDLRRIRGNEGLPIEVMDSQRLLFKSRQALVNTIIDYNIAQFELYRALGNPQAALLIRPVDEVPPELTPSESKGD
jgi:outer membrane protein TolC